MLENKGKVVSSFFWKLCERGASQFITIIVQIILARLLAPEDFGKLAILVVFIDLANVFIQKGFASSIIRKKNATDEDYNTAFVVSELIAIVCITLLFFVAPLIGKFYGDSGINWCLRGMSISLIFGALYSIENAVLVKQLKFKFVFIRSLSASLVSGAIGIVLALFGFGIWALVFQSVSQQIILCVATYIGCDWKPKIKFSKESFKNIYSFGSKILVAEIISMGVENLRTLMIGKKYTTSELAYYERGLCYPSAAMRAIYDTISSVMLPVFSKEQDEKKRLAVSIEETIIISSFLIFPLFIGLAAASEQFVIVLLTERWRASIPYLVIFSIYELVFPMYGILRQSLYAIGKSNTVLKLEIIKGVLFISAIYIGTMISTYAIAIATAISLYVTTGLYYIYVYEYISFDYRKIVKNVGISLGQCVIMFFVLRLLNQITLPSIVLLLVDVIVGGMIYLLTSILFHNRVLKLMLDCVRKKKR